jgi:hypothetical protein
MLPKPATPHGACSSSEPLLYLQQTSAIAESDIRKLIHDPVELFTRMVQPILWLVVFGQVFARARAIPTGRLRYLISRLPGFLRRAYSLALSSTVFRSSGNATWAWSTSFWSARRREPLSYSEERCPPRFADFAKLWSSYVVAFLLGVQLRLEWRAIAGVLAVVGLGAATFSTFSPHCSLHRQVSRALYGDWTGSHDALVFREQRDLSVEHDAGRVVFSIQGESVDLPGGRAEIHDGSGRSYGVRTGFRSLRSNPDVRSPGRNRGQALSEHCPLSGARLAAVALLRLKLRQG